MSLRSIQVPTPESIHAGQAVYSPAALRWYDFLVLNVSNLWIWRCPTPRLVELYNQHVTANHLEVGVGTGYFLDHCHFPTATPRLVLADLNPHCLAAACQRVQRFYPQTLLHSVFQPFPREIGQFDSIGLNYVLHCLPGEPALVLENLRAALQPGGVLFGSTILSQPANLIARQLMLAYNRKGIFCNLSDTEASLRAELTQVFDDVEIDRIGCVARFVARIR